MRKLWKSFFTKDSKSIKYHSVSKGFGNITNSVSTLRAENLPNNILLTFRFLSPYDGCAICYFKNFNVSSEAVRTVKFGQNCMAQQSENDISTS